MAPIPAIKPPAAARWEAPLDGAAAGELLTAALEVGEEAGAVALAITWFVLVLLLALCD